MTKAICPTCRTPTTEDQHRWRPFCSERCRLLDLSKWLNGDYAIPVNDAGWAPDSYEPGEE